MYQQAQASCECEVRCVVHHDHPITTLHHGGHLQAKRQGTQAECDRRRHDVQRLHDRKLTILQHLLRQHQTDGLTTFGHQHEQQSDHRRLQLAPDHKRRPQYDHAHACGRGRSRATNSQCAHNCENYGRREGLQHLDEAQAEVQVDSVARGERHRLRRADGQSHTKPLDALDGRGRLRVDFGEAQANGGLTEKQCCQHATGA
mmetsp:Transcript_10826/g.32062  ORF Transcript_10826/g.32062 Transcript_10826/m.32062 type:complete len:202 (-) Transcript_10826:621-1226(-)